MPARLVVRPLALLTAVVALSGCSSILGTDDEPQFLRVGACRGPAFDPPEEVVAPLRPGTSGSIVAREVPGFGGAFHDGQQLVLLLTEPEREAEMKAALIATGNGDYSRAIVRRARWDLAQLEDWRLYIFATVDLTGLTSMTNDPRQNRLVWGIESAEARRQVATQLKARGIPCDLVLLEVSGRAVSL